MHTGNTLSWFRRHPFASAALIFTAIAFGPLSMDAQADGGSGKGGGGAALAAPDRAGTGIINNAADICTPNETAPFFHNRRVTGRNTPSVVNATFNRQNFWDGRANDNFNGSDPFGLTGNAGAGIGQTATNSSLASQAVGPPNN